jgi:16S rRNA (uracil1498-N3)-methyltransferase
VTARFYSPLVNAPGDLVTLPEDEGQHLTRVLRMGAGDLVRVFNGRGGEFESVVEALAKDGVRVRVGEPRASAPEPRLAITLAQAVLKGDKMDDVVRDAVMIGATSIQPIVTSRIEVNTEALERGHRRERWERVAVSSAKQCGRAVVPHVLEPVSLESLTQTLLGSWLAGPSLMLVEPGASKTAVALGELDVEPPKAATVVVGPEGGWTPEEIEAAQTVCRLVTLGGRTLRADAMALVALAALYARWGEF